QAQRGRVYACLQFLAVAALKDFQVHGHMVEVCNGQASNWSGSRHRPPPGVAAWSPGGEGSPGVVALLKAWRYGRDLTMSWPRILRQPFAMLGVEHTQH